MFILSLLVLLMDIQVTFACECQEAEWLRAMCPEENKTVISGKLLNESSIGCTSQSGMSVLHYVKLYELIKDGSNRLTEYALDEGVAIKMISPEGCSLVYDKSDVSYFTGGNMIYGETDADGVLHSSKCTAAPLTGFFEEKDDYVEIMLYGEHGKLTC